MDQLLTFMNRFPADWRLPSWFQYGCGLRIGEALAINANNFLAGGAVYRVEEQVDPDGNVIPCKWRKKGEYRDVPVPAFVWDEVPAAHRVVPAGRGWVCRVRPETPSGGA